MADLPALAEVGTLGAMASRVVRWGRENFDDDILNDTINDAIESLWMAASLASISKFVGRPVHQIIPSGSQDLVLVTIPDPTDYLQPGETAGGILPTRQYTVAYTLVTDSGSCTNLSPGAVADVDASALLTVPPPVPLTPECIGWNLYAGQAGRLILQNIEPIPFNRLWIEPMLGLNSSPDGPLPPTQNNTGDNIFSITRIDVENQDLTKTNWLQTSIGSTAFTTFQNRYPLASTFPRHAYDLIGNTTVEFRPAAGTDLDATLFYITRPRRLRFSISRLPFTNFASQRFIFCQSMSDALLSVREDEGSDRWQKKADAERQLIVMSIVGETLNQNVTVRPYMRW